MRRITDGIGLDPDCQTCDGTGWVCEAHSDKPWSGISNREDACDHGPGMPCEVCRIHFEGSDQ